MKAKTSVFKNSILNSITRIGLLLALLGVGFQMGCQGKSESESQASAKDHSEIEKSALEAEQADEDISKLKAHAGAGSESTARTPTSAGSKTKERAHKKDVSYFVQVGTFKVEENASKVLKQLKEKGLPGMMKRIEKDNGLVLYAVRLEPTPKRAEAESMLSSVKEATGQSGLVVSARE